jgi:hypothetical protein
LPLAESKSSLSSLHIEPQLNPRNLSVCDRATPLLNQPLLVLVLKTAFTVGLMGFHHPGFHLRALLVVFPFVRMNNGAVLLAVISASANSPIV